MPKAYSYIRMSTPEQLKGDSTRRQLKASEDYAKEHGLQLAEILNDRGVPAYRGQNAEMGKLADFLTLAKSGQIDDGSYLIVESLDRISRANVLKAMSLLNDIVECGIVIVTLIDGQMYSKEIVSKNPMAMMVAAMVLMRAHEESHTKSVRLAAAWANKRSTARNGQVTKQRLPHWLCFSQDGLSIDVIQERAEIVREIFDLSGGGWGAVSIAKWLNDRGIATWGRASHWQESYVKKILGNRSVLGEYQPQKLSKDLSIGRRLADGPPIQNYYPRVIDEVTFLYAQEAIARRRIIGKGRKGAKFPNLFTGFLRCKYCKSGMRFIDKGAPPKGGQYLRCSKALVTQDCLGPAFRYEVVEQHLLQIIRSINFDAVLNNPAWLSQTKELRQQELDLAKSETDLQRQIANVADAVADNGSSPTLLLKLNELEMRLEEARQEKSDVRHRLGQLNVTSGLDYVALIEALRSPELTDSERSGLRRKFSAELGKLLVRIEIGRSYPTPSIGIPVELFENLTLLDLENPNRFIEIMVLYKTGGVTEFDAFTGEQHHFDMSPQMAVLREKAFIEKLA